MKSRKIKLIKYFSAFFLQAGHQIFHGRQETLPLSTMTSFSLRRWNIIDHHDDFDDKKMVTTTKITTMITTSGGTRHNL